MNNLQLDFPLVTCEWLVCNQGLDGIVILDGTFFLPNQARNAYDEFCKAHIPGAQFFDIDLVADRTNPLPHMLPFERKFEKAVGEMGIDNQTKVVVYDNNAFMASARVWWTFRTFGHNNVFVLNGGFKLWQAEGREIEHNIIETPVRKFNSDFKPGLVCDLGRMKSIVNDGSRTIIDARSPGRYSGDNPEIRPGLRSGHIPGSVNLHYATLVNQETGEFVSVEQLEALYSHAGVDPKTPIVTTCGSGVTACMLALGLYCLNAENIPVYDGSWSEWGGLQDVPIATGE